jgi:PAP2 superfamily
MRITALATHNAGGRLSRWLSVRHSLPTEAAVVLGLYGLYELTRGLVVGDADVASAHANWLVAVERSLHLLFEANVQPAVHALPGLTGLLGVAYLTLHLAVTAGVLLWLHQRHPAAFPFVRTTLLLASGLALVGFLVYPTAPPRLADIGIADTVSSAHVDLNRGLVSSLYNRGDYALPWYSSYIAAIVDCRVSTGKRGGCNKPSKKVARAETAARRTLLAIKSSPLPWRPRATYRVGERVAEEVFSNA